MEVSDTWYGTKSYDFVPYQVSLPILDEICCFDYWQTVIPLPKSSGDSTCIYEVFLLLI
ncbi:hypothetical protein [Bacillus sp. AFS098217]|uniref:hypothetical protein n=1 Tax=Bacillus sp. AFS098217 TaxID=2033868 RepID=UPI0015CF0513|nr:hypothetical protein [Bacillus sp. AFS098217]